MKIAIIGPDGSGKTSIVDYLHKNIPGSKKIYAGKKKNHILPTTKVALWLWKKSKKTNNQYIIMFFRFFVFYPFEYIENLIKFLYHKKNKIIIFDRHPIDRLVLMNQIPDLIKGQHKIIKKRRIKKITVEYKLLKIISSLYIKFFPRIDKVFLLLPDKETIFKRSGGQYVDLEEVKIRINAFKRSISQLSRRQKIETILISEKEDISDIGKKILNKLKLK